jgi:uncharacterized membrane protein
MSSRKRGLIIVSIVWIIVILYVAFFAKIFYRGYESPKFKMVIIFSIVFVWIMNLLGLVKEWANIDESKMRDCLSWKDRGHIIFCIKCMNDFKEFEYCPICLTNRFSSHASVDEFKQIQRDKKINSLNEN